MTLFATMYPQRVIKMVYLDAAYDRRKNFSCDKRSAGWRTTAGVFAHRRRGDELPGWEKIVAPECPARHGERAGVDDEAAMQFVPDYKKITAPSLAIYADPDLPQNAGKLDAETQKKLDAWWKEKQVPIARASIEQFRKEMKNGQIVEIKGATHYVFVGHTRIRLLSSREISSRSDLGNAPSNVPSLIRSRFIYEAHYPHIRHRHSMFAGCGASSNFLARGAIQNASVLRLARGL
jgi:pimeloyl-ACP methyl ester carboxylesterase